MFRKVDRQNSPFQKRLCILSTCLMDSRPVSLVHLIELIDTTDTLIGHHESTTCLLCGTASGQSTSVSAPLTAGPFDTLLRILCIAVVGLTPCGYYTCTSCKHAPSRVSSLVTESLTTAAVSPTPELPLPVVYTPLGATRAMYLINCDLATQTRNGPNATNS